MANKIPGLSNFKKFDTLWLVGSFFCQQMISYKAGEGTKCKRGLLKKKSAPCSYSVSFLLRHLYGLEKKRSERRQYQSSTDKISIMGENWSEILSYPWNFKNWKLKGIVFWNIHVYCIRKFEVTVKNAQGTRIEN